MASLVERGLRTLCFAKSRKSAELIHRFTLDRLGHEYRDRSPRTGRLHAAQRREHRAAARRRRAARRGGDDALELGHRHRPARLRDLDRLPGHGREPPPAVGPRRTPRPRPRVLVASEDALDQYFMREPETLLRRRVEAAILDHANPRVLDGHVQAAAFEAPLDDGDRDGSRGRGTRACGAASGAPAHAGGYVWAGRDYPAARVPLRSTSPDAFSVIDTSTGSVLGLVERERAYSTVHDGAVYLHLGQSYRVAELDHAARVALVSPFDGDLYTQAKKDTTTAIEEPQRVEPRLGLELTWGRVSVTEQVVAYQVKQVSTQATLDLVALDLPETTFETEAVWFSPPDELLEGIDQMPKLLGALHAAEHALIALLPLWAMCDRWDIGGLSTNIHFQTGRPTIFVYDGHPGGVGITERGLRGVRGLGGRHRKDDRRLPVRARLPVSASSRRSAAT
jgi:DEAD/DEAH box helicase domain-containing protein